MAFTPDPKCKYNQLNVEPYDFSDNDKYRAQCKRNFEIVDQLKDIIVFSHTPVPGKVTVTPASVRRGCHKHRILSNPIRLKNELIALYCDNGNLCFGWSINKATITIWTD